VADPVSLDPMRMRITRKGDVADVKMLIFHPMETGYRTNKVTGETIPKHFIKTLQAMHNGTTVLEAEWSRSVSRNPFLHFRLTGAKSGDKVTIAWQDNFEQTGGGEAIVK
jgi:sulfur-oxidizing protein SoxZ